jgi:hypothetical protein
MRFPAYVVICALVPAAMASAADFTFHVPIDLESLPAAVQSYYAECHVYDNDPDGTGWKVLGNSGDVKHPITAGQSTLKTTLTVAFNVDPSQASSPAQAKWYRCTLWLCSDTTPGNYSGCSLARLPGSQGSATAPVWSIAAANSGSVVSVKGQIPTK